MHYYYLLVYGVVPWYIYIDVSFFDDTIIYTSIKFSYRILKELQFNLFDIYLR